MRGVELESVEKRPVAIRWLYLFGEPDAELRLNLHWAEFDHTIHILGLSFIFLSPRELLGNCLVFKTVSNHTLIEFGKSSFRLGIIRERI